jgi:hypothetical protein
MRWERAPAGWRWLVAGGAVAVLVALPGLVGAVPARDRPVGAAELLARVLGSEPVAYQGYAEARAGLGLPDVPRAGRVVALLGETTRMRAFVAGPEDWRVDELTPVGERDLYRTGWGTWQWDSGERRVVATQGEAAVRFARPADLLPPELGRRVAAAAGNGEVARLGARRVAGVQALGLRIVPRSAGTTVARADLWADAASGLPVRVELTAKGRNEPIVTSAFLDLRLGVRAGRGARPPGPVLAPDPRLPRQGADQGRPMGPGQRDRDPAAQRHDLRARRGRLRARRDRQPAAA